MRVIASDAGKVVLLESFVVVAEWEAPGATPAAITSDKPRSTAGDRGADPRPVLVPARGHSDSANRKGSNSLNSACPVRGTALVNRVPMSGRRKALLLVT